MLYYARPLGQLLEQLEKLPGIGPKSAQRLAFHLLRAPSEQSHSLAQAVLNVRDKIHPCARCGNYTDEELCDICLDARRDDHIVKPRIIIRKKWAKSLAGWPARFRVCRFDSGEW